MIAKLIFFWFTFVLAGSSLSPKILANFNEKIVAGDINALHSLIETNSKFINSPFTMRYREDGFIKAVQQGRAPVVEFMLENVHINPAARNNEAIRIASAIGDIDMFRLLLNRPEVNPGAMNNEALVNAVKYGRVEIVRLLLANPNNEINAAARNNEAIRLASGRDNIDMVRLLLNRPEVNPGAMNNEALIDAVRYRNIEIVRLLLAHPNVEPSAQNSLAAEWAARMVNHDMLKLFIEDGRVNPAIFKHRTLEYQAGNGNVEFVRFLLEYPYFSQDAHILFMQGDFYIIKTLVEAGYKIDRDTLERASQHATLIGNFKTANYLQSLKEPPKLADRPLIAMTEQCAICLADDNLLEGIMTSCNHQFHAECLQQWIARHNSCPMCRSSII